jgi:hypothetical protein
MQRKATKLYYANMNAGKVFVMQSNATKLVG